MSEFLQRNGDVRQLRTYKIATVISVSTEIFIRRFIARGSRTIDQMQQAARSCKQNIVEGSEAATTSKETEIKLTNVARASLGELLDDYLDYLNFHHLNIWGIDHPRTLRLRQYLRTPDFESNYVALCEKLNAEEFCNLMITLIRQEQRMLDGMLKRMQENFIINGGIREQMTRARLNYRNKN